MSELFENLPFLGASKSWLEAIPVFNFPYHALRSPNVAQDCSN